MLLPHVHMSRGAPALKTICTDNSNENLAGLEYFNLGIMILQPVSQSILDVDDSEFQSSKVC